MKTLLLLFSLLLFTQCYKTSEPATVTSKFCNPNDFYGFDNYLGWDNNSLQMQSLLHLKNNSMPDFFAGETLRIRRPISKEFYWQDLHDNIFIGRSGNFCIPDADTCIIETDSEIKIHQTDSLLYYTPLPLPGC